MSVTLEAVLKECPEWFHSIELSPGVVTPGRKTPEILEGQLRAMALPDLRGKSVLDIGAYDGYFSFAAERLGAARVVALDHHVWYADMAAYMRDWEESKQTGALLPPPNESRHFRPSELPGRKPFDFARRTLRSKVEPVVGDFMTMDREVLGTFDVVLFLGVLYHMEEPLRAMRCLRSLVAPGGLAVVETEAIEAPGLGERPVCEFFPGQELNNDPSNWWSPNASAIEGLCRAAGFSTARVLNRARPPVLEWIKGGLRGDFELPVTRYRAVAHARR